MKSVLLILILTFVPGSWAQTARSRGKIPRPAQGNEQAFSAALSYSGLTDFADDRAPRMYTHNFGATIGYQMNERWSLEAAVGVRAEALGGQIEKGKEQSYDEVLSPSTSFSASYEGKLSAANSYGFALNGEPLWDTTSRLEGYRGVVGIDGKWTSGFFKRRYVMTHSFNVSELINTYKYSSEGSANPDYFLSYKFANVFRLFSETRLAYTFGAKMTRYMDDFIGYSYSNTISLSQGFGKFTAVLAYENGGFTDKGEISLWFIDEYRRLVRLALNYTF
jgi:hypothetical protein